MNKLLALLLLLFSTHALAQAPDTVLAKTTMLIYDMGTGFIVEAPRTHKKFLLTNWHVCRLAAHQDIMFMTETGWPGKATILGVSIQDDLCIASISQRRAALKVGAKLKVGDTIYSHGYPLGKFNKTFGILESRFHWVSDLVRDFGFSECPSPFIPGYNADSQLVSCDFNQDSGLTTLYAAPGSSGSPVVNSKGELVGMIQTSLGLRNTYERKAGIIEIDTITRILDLY